MKNHDRPVTLRASVWQRCRAHRESIDWERSPMTKRKVGFYELEHGAHCSWLVGKWGWDRTWSVLRQSWGHTGDSPELEEFLPGPQNPLLQSSRMGGEWGGTGDRQGQRPHRGGSPSSPCSALAPASPEVTHKSDHLTSLLTPSMAPSAF